MKNDIAIRRGRKVTKIVLVIIILLAAFSIPFELKKDQNEYASVSQLVDVLSLAGLSTSELIYNGIADIYDESGQRILYSIAYDSTIKAGIQMDTIEFETDDSQRIIKPILPAITIQSPVIDPSSIDYIPNNSNVDLKTAIAACREDAMREAERSEKLLQTAEENLRSIVEALLLPITDDAGYTIKW